jgi:hypothetical protein
MLLLQQLLLGVQRRQQQLPLAAAEGRQKQSLR